ncbi:phosphoribosyltransferase family protein [Arthrobacter sp. RIT-PI-e]|uniref:phosphoribosyltransferase family protein n=1 Tax=Arthrobacter sp. RIT-PI-e TaxID=1681197 RepID=UPI000676AC10|nr:phosphoribosyltransferase family protein [Arthrobacter sp. RIT-PI-e]
MRALRSVLLPGLQGGQKGLGRRRRRAQVGSSMRLSPRAGESLRGVRCIVVDDVLTTGATLGEVHRGLTGGGARGLGAVVVAATTSPAGDGAGGPGGRVPVPTRMSKVPVSNG